MSTTTRFLDEELRDYVTAVSVLREDGILARLRQETAGLPMGIMQISVEQGRLMAMLTMALRFRRCLEVGVFTGYSSLCVARHLPPDGRLVACDVSEEWTSIAKRYWQEAGVAGRVDLRLGPAAGTLDALIDAGESATYDFAFIDADKESYGRYYDLCLTLLRPGGLVAIDNMFMSGKVVDPSPEDKGSTAVRDLTKRIFEDPRVDPSLIPIGDGLLLARKR